MYITCIKPVGVASNEQALRVSVTSMYGVECIDFWKWGFKAETQHLCPGLE